MAISSKQLAQLCLAARSQKTANEPAAAPAAAAPRFDFSKMDPRLLGALGVGGGSALLSALLPNSRGDRLKDIVTAGLLGAAAGGAGGHVYGSLQSGRVPMSGPTPEEAAVINAAGEIGTREEVVTHPLAYAALPVAGGLAGVPVSQWLDPRYASKARIDGMASNRKAIAAGVRNNRIRARGGLAGMAGGLALDMVLRKFFD